MLTINKEETIIPTSEDYSLDVDTKQCKGTFQNTSTKETGILKFIQIAPHIYMLTETDIPLPELVIWRLRNSGIIVPMRLSNSQ